MGQILQQEDRDTAAWLTLQWLQGLLRCVHEVSPGGCRRASGKAKESHLQCRALWEYRRMDSGECSNSSAPYDYKPVLLCFSSIFNFSVVAQDHWWAVLLMGIALIMLMAGFIKICSVHTPSSNPKLPPPKPLPGTVHVHLYLYTWVADRSQHSLTLCDCYWDVAAL